MKQAIILFLISFVSSSQALIYDLNNMTEEKLVEQIIKDDAQIYFNPTEGSEEDRLECLALNAGGIEFQHLMLSSTDQSLKTCYALKILNTRISAFEGEFSKENHEKDVVSEEWNVDRILYENFISQRIVVARYLEQIQEKQANQGMDLTRSNAQSVVSES